MVDFEICDVTWLTKNYNILFNISQIKGNQTMKFGQSIKHPKRDIFLEKFLYDDIINLYYRFMF